MSAQNQRIEQYYNRREDLRHLKIGDFVLRKAFQSKQAVNSEWYGLRWEGKYQVHGMAGKGAYELETMDRKVLPSNWNVVHLKKYYF